MSERWTPREVATFFPVSLQTVNRMVGLAKLAGFKPTEPWSVRTGGEHLDRRP